jgi:hypothetical protein
MCGYRYTYAISCLVSRKNSGDSLKVYLMFSRYKNNQEIQPSGRCSVFNDQNGTYSLVISDALPQDSGSYEITIQNQYGTANSKTNLQILG